MEFNSAVHTKDYLLNHKDELTDLAKDSVEFATSELAQDISIFLKVPEVAFILAEHQPLWAKTPAAQRYEVLIIYAEDEPDNTVAHHLATFQAEWALTAAVSDHHILRIQNDEGKTVAHKLAQYQPNWLNSVASKNYAILKMADASGNSVAHILATHQEKWLESSASEDYDILRLDDHYGTTVAHRLACNQKQWINSRAASNYEILKLSNKEQLTVAHSFARYSPNWYQSKAANDYSILLMNTDDGRSVALFMTFQDECLSHPLIFQKNILTLENKGKLLGESLIERYQRTHGIDFCKIAMKLITQGAAYKHSQFVEAWEVQELYERALVLIEDSIEPLLALKFAIALYSTCFYGNEQARSINSPEMYEWQSVLSKSEKQIQNVLKKHPQLWEVEFPVDLLCEPGENYFKQLKSAKCFHELRVDAVNDSTDNPSLVHTIY
jgi:hypothetical protein